MSTRIKLRIHLCEYSADVVEYGSKLDRALACFSPSGASCLCILTVAEHLVLFVTLRGMQAVVCHDLCRVQCRADRRLLCRETEAPQPLVPFPV